MDPKTSLYVVVDPRGVTLAYPTEAEAVEALDGDMPPQTVRRTTFGEYLAENPRGLVRLQSQYYWAEDLRY